MRATRAPKEPFSHVLCLVLDYYNVTTLNPAACVFQSEDPLSNGVDTFKEMSLPYFEGGGRHRDNSHVCCLT